MLFRLLLAHCLLFLVACTEAPCGDGPQIPPSIVQAGFVPSETNTCSFGSATESNRWENIGYIKVAHKESVIDVARQYQGRLTAMGWTEVDCDGNLGAKSVDGVLQCFLTRRKLTRLEAYELDGTLVDVDLYQVNQTTP